MKDEAHGEGQGDVTPFTTLVLRHQEMAFGYALAILRDPHLAQDATQEAFIAAYFGLTTLNDPAKFPQWLRGIVRHQCWRILRRQRMITVALDEARAVPVAGRSVEEETETREGLRTILFYVGEHSQREIAAFLDLPVTKVNNRIHAARQLLKERRLVMPQDNTTRHPLPATFADRIGQFVHRRGALIEARFPAGVPPVLNALAIDDDADAPTVSVIQHLPGGIVRGILDRDAPLATGSALTDTGQPSTRQTTPRMLAAILAALDTPVAPTAPDDLLETGIKAVDLFCPLPRHGTIAVLGDMGVGKAVVLGELVQNLTGTVQTSPHDVGHILIPIVARNPPGLAGSWAL
jgi:DNA-directed RNA polymerase specialized sigma24 family protein